MSKVIWLALLGGLASQALAGSISAQLQTKRIGVDQATRLVVVIAGEQQSQVQVPEVDGLVIAQRGTSQNMQWINGVMTSELEISYVIRPQKIGTFTIPPFKANIDGKQEESLPLTLEVVAAGQGPSPSRGRQQANPTANAKKGDHGIFAERTCENTNPYVGEQVLCKSKLYYPGNIRQTMRILPPSSDLRQLRLEGKKSRQQRIRGRIYIVDEFEDVVVATKPGRVELPPMRFDAQVQVRVRGRFGMFFDMFNTEQARIESNPVSLTVKPLPEQGKPKDFSGLVGQFELSADVSPGQIKTGETATVTVTAKGQGLVDRWDFSMPKAWEQLGKVYADKPEYEEKSVPGLGIVSQKTLRWALVPTQTGALPLSFTFSYFDPEVEMYRSQTVDAGTLIVEQGDGSEQVVAVTPTPTRPVDQQTAVKVLGEGLLALHRARDLARDDRLASQFVWPLLAGGGPLALGLLAFGWQLVRSRRDRDPLRKLAEASYRKLASAMEQNSSDGAQLAMIWQELRQYVGYKVGKEGGALTPTEVADCLGQLGVGSELTAAVRKFGEACETFQYAGRMPASVQVDSLVQVLKEVRSK